MQGERKRDTTVVLNFFDSSLDDNGVLWAGCTQGEARDKLLPVLIMLVLSCDVWYLVGYESNTH